MIWFHFLRSASLFTRDWRITSKWILFVWTLMSIHAWAVFVLSACIAAVSVITTAQVTICCWSAPCGPPSNHSHVRETVRLDGRTLECWYVILFRQEHSLLFHIARTCVELQLGCTVLANISSTGPVLHRPHFCWKLLSPEQWLPG